MLQQLSASNKFPQYSVSYAIFSYHGMAGRIVENDLLHVQEINIELHDYNPLDL